MSDYDSNYSDITCPFCDTFVCNHKNYDQCISDLSEDFDEDFFQCPECEKFFKVELAIHTEYDYIVTEPTEEEIKENGFSTNKDIDEIEDVEGQTFMWNDLY